MKGEHTSVEFYLIDAFEIFHFLPLYYLFERRGIQVKFVAEPPESNTSGKWFDYNRAIEILEVNKVRYEKNVTRIVILLLQPRNLNCSANIIIKR